MPQHAPRLPPGKTGFWSTFRPEKSFHAGVSSGPTLVFLRMRIENGTFSPMRYPSQRSPINSQSATNVWISLGATSARKRFVSAIRSSVFSFVGIRVACLPQQLPHDREADLPAADTDHQQTPIIKTLISVSPNCQLVRSMLTVNPLFCGRSRKSSCPKASKSNVKSAMNRWMRR